MTPLVPFGLLLLFLASGKRNAGASDSMESASGSPERARIVEQAKRLESELGWPGLATYLTAVASAESDFHPSAIGDGGLAVGAFQQHPSTLAAGQNIAWRSDPEKSVVLAVDLIRRLARYDSAMDWGMIRRGWKYPSWAKHDQDTNPAAQAVESRFRARLEKLGFPASFASSLVNAPALASDWWRDFV